LQDSLTSVTYLSDIVQQCKAVGLDIEATAQNEVANVLWEQGEAETSIRMRQHLIDHTKFDSQSTDISLPVLLARLVSAHCSRSRFENRVTNVGRVIIWRKLGLQSQTRLLANISSLPFEN
jgi:ataxia telangiectasia mutated family protein